MTPILQTLLPLVNSYGTLKAVEWLEGREELTIPDDDLTSFLARHDVVFDELLTDSQDQIRDEYLESVKVELAKRLAPSDSEPKSSPLELPGYDVAEIQKLLGKSEAPAAMKAGDVFSSIQSIRPYIEGLEDGPHKRTMTKGWNFMVYGMEDPNAVNIRPDWLKPFTENPSSTPFPVSSHAAASLPVSGQDVEGVVKRAVEALDELELVKGWIFMKYNTSDRTDCQAMGRMYNVISALSELRLLTFEGRPKALHPPVQALPSQGPDVPPLGPFCLRCGFLENHHYHTSSHAFAPPHPDRTETAQDASLAADRYLGTPSPGKPVVQPGEGWRLLQEGEPIQEGDGFLDPSYPHWISYECRPDIFRATYSRGKEVAHTWPWRRKIGTAAKLNA